MRALYRAGGSGTNALGVGIRRVCRVDNRADDAFEPERATIGACHGLRGLAIHAIKDVCTAHASPSFASATTFRTPANHLPVALRVQPIEAVPNRRARLLAGRIASDLPGAQVC